MEQLEDNLASLEVRLPAEQMAQLQATSTFEPGSFYSLFEGQVNRSIFGGVQVDGWPSGAYEPPLGLAGKSMHEPVG